MYRASDNGGYLARAERTWRTGADEVIRRTSGREDGA